MGKNRKRNCIDCDNIIWHTAIRCRACSAKLKTRSLAERFWEKVNRRSVSECWEWTASKYRNGYGKIGEGGKYGKQILAHRVSYELVNGQIPEGLVIDHLCRNRDCVNPKHLEAVSQNENLLRGETIPAKHSQKTLCKNGHPFTGRNIRGDRICHTCDAIRARKYKQQKREQKQSAKLLSQCL